MLVKGSVSIAQRLRISTLIVGLTVVSFATSAPELFVSLQAALEGRTNIVFGNIIGSNIANIAFVLAVTAMIFRLNISSETYRINYPFMLSISIMLSLFLYFFNVISVVFGYVFVLILICFLAFLIKKATADRNDSSDNFEIQYSLTYSISFIILGILSLKYGADWLVEGTIYIAKIFSVSDRVIAVTVVAIGTSVPELATSIVGAFKKEEDLVVGNLIGSNIFNILAVLGITSACFGLSIDDVRIITFDIPWMILISLVIGLFIYYKSAKVISRKEGFFLFALYIIYMYLSIS